MKPFTVILYCACGCDCYEIHHVFAKSKEAAPKKVKPNSVRPLEVILVLKGHCEEA